MTNTEIDKKFWELFNDFNAWKDEVVEFINNIENPDIKNNVTDLLLMHVGTTELDVKCRTKQI